MPTACMRTAQPESGLSNSHAAQSDDGDAEPERRKLLQGSFASRYFLIEDDAYGMLSRRLTNREPHFRAHLSPVGLSKCIAPH